MCCNMCDYYFKCQEVQHQDALCCSKCGELDDCGGERVAGSGMMGDDFEDNDLDDDDDFEDFDDEEDDLEDYDIDDEYDSNRPH